MKELEKERIVLEHLGIPKRLLPKVYGLIDVNDYKNHMKSRKELVKAGKKILPVMYKMLKSDEKVIRKEAMKVVERIADPTSIPVAINMLEDRESEVRWIAAEALIRIGRESITPLLKALISNGISFYLRQGAHHVLSTLIRDKDSKELKQLVHLLKPGLEIPDIIPVYAKSALTGDRQPTGHH